MSAQPVFLPPRPDDPAGGEPASWGARAGALLLDGLFMLVIAVAAGALAEALGAGTHVDQYYEDGTFYRDEYPVALLVGVGAFLVASVLYPWILMGAMGGRTPGRRVAGIRVVRVDGRPPGYGYAFLREIVIKWALGLFTLPLLFSYLMPLMRQDRRALHDLMASTRVVRDRPAPEGSPPAPATPAPASDDLSRRIGLGG